jgi:hypothetical protein
MADLDALVTTRLGLQAVAEHVLSAALHAANGRIGLRPAPGGFGTPAFPSEAGDRRLRVVGVELVVEDGDGTRAAPLTTLREVAAFADVTPGAPTDVYTPTTPLDLDAPLAVVDDEASALADWFALVSEALEALRAEHADLEPAISQLWPEHFDLATTIAEVNHGGSPGDGTHPEPYLYVGPWNVPEGAFWNEPFGASLGRAEVPDAEAALVFFRRGFAEAAR